MPAGPKHIPAQRSAFCCVCLVARADVARSLPLRAETGRRSALRAADAPCLGGADTAVPLMRTWREYRTCPRARAWRVSSPVASRLAGNQGLVGAAQAIDEIRLLHIPADDKHQQEAGLRVLAHHAVALDALLFKAELPLAVA